MALSCYKRRVLIIPSVSPNFLKSIILKIHTMYLNALSYSWLQLVHAGSDYCLAKFPSILFLWKNLCTPGDFRHLYFKISHFFKNFLVISEVNSVKRDSQLWPRLTFGRRSFLFHISSSGTNEMDKTSSQEPIQFFLISSQTTAIFLSVTNKYMLVDLL